MKHKISIIILLIAILTAPCAALVEEMRTAARSLPALIEVVTIEELVALLPGGAWPVTVGL